MFRGVKDNSYADVGSRDAANNEIITKQRKILRLIPNYKKRLNQEYEGNAKGFEFNEWRKGRQSPYPLVWNEDKFREYERMIKEAGLSEDWVRWLLRGLSSSINDPDYDDSLSFTSSVLNQARIDAENKGEDGQGLLWECMSVSVSFRKFLEEQKENMPQHSPDEKQDKVEVIPVDAVLKIRVIVGLSKLKEIFSDLEEQGFVEEGTTLKLEGHFTDSALKEAVPKNATPIEWIATLYELRSLIRSLRSSDSIEGDLSSVARHFLFRGKIVTRSQLESGAIGTEKLDRLENLLSRHDIHCVP